MVDGAVGEKSAGDMEMERVVRILRLPSILTSSRLNKRKQDMTNDDFEYYMRYSRVMVVDVVAGIMATTRWTTTPYGTFMFGGEDDYNMNNRWQ